MPDTVNLNIDFFNLTPNPIWVYSEETLQVVKVNLAACKRYGFSLNEFVGKSILDLRPPEDVPKLLTAIADRSNWTAQSGPWRHRTKDGTVFFAETYSFSYRFNGQDCRVVQVVDVTDRVNADSERNAFFDASLDIITVGTADGQLLRINNAFTRILGWPKEMLLHKQFRDLTHPDDLAASDAASVQIRDGNDLVNFEARFAAANGEWKHLQWNVKSDAATKMLYSVARDVTDQRAAEMAMQATEARLREAQEVARIGYFHVDLITNVVQWSDLVYDIFELSKDSWIPNKDNYFDWIHPDDRESFQSFFFDAVKTRDSFARGHRIITGGGNERYISGFARVSRDESGAPTAAFGTMQDVTELKLAEVELARRESQLRSLLADNNRLLEELRETNLHLEEIVVERTKALTEANQELESFSYSVAHDIRAPLRGIDGFSQILESDYGYLLDDQGREYLSRVREQTNRIGDLIDDLLSLARLSRTELNVETVDLSKVAHDCFDSFQLLEPNRKVEIQIQDGMKARGDLAMIRILLDNLLGNAWKFTKNAAEPRIKVGTIVEGGVEKVVVTDNGAGFDMAHGGMLFRPFHRLHTTKQFPGTGVGLAIADRVVKRHGGTISGEGAIGKGATFQFTLSNPK